MSSKGNGERKSKANPPVSFLADGRKEVIVTPAIDETAYGLKFVNQEDAAYFAEHIEPIVDTIINAIPENSRNYFPASRSWTITAEYWLPLRVMLESLQFKVTMRPHVGTDDRAPQPEYLRPPGKTLSRPSMPSRFKNEVSGEFQDVTSEFQDLRRRLRVVAPKSLRIPLLASLSALALAVFGDLPYDFFVLLRVLVFITCCMSLAIIWRYDRTSNWIWVFISIAVLYNPFLLIHLHKSTWSWINFIAFIVLGLFCLILKPIEVSHTESTK